MSDKSRRKLLKSIAAGSGAIVAGKSLPDSWSKPVIDSVMLPAHAQTSPTPTTFTQTLGYDFPQGTLFGGGTDKIPDQTFVFNVGSIVPTGDGQVDITNLVGDFNSSNEIWTISIGATLLGSTNFDSGASTPASPAPSQWTVPLAVLQAALSGGEITITAVNGPSDGIQTFPSTNTMDVTLFFPGQTS